MSNPIDPEIAAQLREVNPDREAVITWTRFRIGAFIQRDPVSSEDIGRVLEFRSMDGKEVHQFVLDEESRKNVIEWLSVDAAPTGIVLPT